MTEQLDMLEIEEKRLKEVEASKARRAKAEADADLLQPIADELKKLGIANIEATVIELPYGHAEFRGVLTNADGEQLRGIEFKEIYSGSEWRSRCIGRGIKVGGYDSRRLFKPLKAGGYNYAGIAQAYAEYMETQQAAAQREQQERNREQAVEALKKEMGFAHSWSSSHNGFNVKAVNTGEQPMVGTFTIRKYGNADDMKAMYKMLKDMGLIVED